MSEPIAKSHAKAFERKTWLAPSDTDGMAENLGAHVMGDAGAGKRGGGWVT